MWWLRVWGRPRLKGQGDSASRFLVEIARGNIWLIRIERFGAKSP